MPSKDLTFRLFGEDVNASLALRNISAEADKSARGISKSFGALPAVVTAVFAVATIASVKLAADFQVASTQLVTGAGESEKNIRKVNDGLLAMAPAVGMGPIALAKAMFLVESAGFHGADGLRVMKAAAEGAKIGGADATVVANALTTAMVNYNLPAKAAAKVTSELVATVAAGKTNMQDLGGALSVVTKPAAAAGISLQQLLGAMGTMTQQGVSAQQSAQDLAATIAALSNPTAVQTQAMAMMGVNSIDVAKNLGKNGLTGTFDTLATSILKNMGPSGLVLQNSFNQSKVAAGSAQEMLDRLPKSLQGLGKEFLNNEITQKQWTAALKGQDVLTSNLGKEFATTAKTANGFSESLRGGGGSAKTFNGLMADMTGGSTGLATGLALTGSHMATFKTNVKAIGGASVEANGNVKGWALTQQDFKVQVEQASAGIQAMGVRIGTALLPMLSGALKVGKDWTNALIENKPALIAVIAVVGAFAAIMVTAFVAQQAYTAAANIARMATDVATAAQWLFNVALDANPIGIIILAIAALVAGLVWFFTQTKLGKEVWTNVTNAIVSAWKWLWGYLEPAFKTLGAVFKWLWETIIQPINGFFVAAFTILAKVVGVIFNDLIIPILKYVGAVFVWLWNTVISPLVGYIGAQIRVLGQIFSWLWQNAIEPAAKAIAKVFSWLWSTVLQPIFSFIGDNAQALGKGLGIVFGGIGDIIRGAFNGVVGFVKGVINGIIDLVNGGIGGINGLSKAASSVFPGMPSLQLGKLPRLATGGTYTGGGLAMVGENGPEIVKLPGGATVYPTGTKMGGGGSGQIVVNMQPPQGFFIGTVAELAKAMNTQFIGGLRNGQISKTELRAALGL